MSTRVVYAIWRAGEVHSSNGRLVFRVTDKALQDTTARTREVLQSWRGSAIVVQPTEDPALDPVLITVLADGEDTYTHRDGTANDQRRRRRMHPNQGRSDEDDS